MAMPRQPGEAHTVNVEGGKGGPGGLGSRQGQGGRGGDGLGPTLNIATATVHVQGGAKINIRRRDAIILDWLSPFDFFPRQDNIKRENGTGKWLLADNLFKKWTSGTQRTVWCHGNLGSGKTVLASMVVDHLHTQNKKGKFGVACIYLDHKKVNAPEPSELLAALWKQLVLDRVLGLFERVSHGFGFHSNVGHMAEKLYQQHLKRKIAPSLRDVVDLLKDSLKKFPKVFIIVDAIDEYPAEQRPILLRYLAEIGSNVHLMITSRPHISPLSFPEVFRNPEILDICATEEDLRTYINARIRDSPYLPIHIETQPQLKEDIPAKIIDSVDGMFLLVKLYLESLREKLTIPEVEEALKHPPEHLNKAYDSSIERINAQKEEARNTACSIITWVVHAERPLTIEELQDALAVGPNTKELNKNKRMDIRIILSVCAGLVIMDKKLEVVQLVHNTTGKYLQAQLFPDVH